MIWSEKIVAKLISELSEDTENSNDWFGPTGKIWCDKMKMMLDPSTCPKGCPECEPLRSQDVKQFRYIHLHDDFKSY